MIAVYNHRHPPITFLTSIVLYLKNSNLFKVKKIICNRLLFPSTIYFTHVCCSGRDRQMSANGPTCLACRSPHVCNCNTSRNKQAATRRDNPSLSRLNDTTSLLPPPISSLMTCSTLEDLFGPRSLFGRSKRLPIFCEALVINNTIIGTVPQTLQ